MYWFCLNFLFVFSPCWLVGFLIFIWRETEKKTLLWPYCNNIHTSVYDKRNDFGLPIVNFPWLNGDVPWLSPYGITISELVRFARCGTSVFDFHSTATRLTFRQDGKTVKRRRHRQYDPAMIERTKGLVFRPFTVLYRSFLKRCTLIYKVVGTVTGLV